MNIIGSTCADGAHAMLSKNSGFISHMKREIPQVTIMHYMLHRYAPASES